MQETVRIGIKKWLATRGHSMSKANDELLIETLWEEVRGMDAYDNGQPAFANAVEYIRADEVEQLKGQLAMAADILRRYRNLPVGGYGQLLGSGAVDEAADAFLETQ